MPEYLLEGERNPIRSGFKVTVFETHIPVCVDKVAEGRFMTEERHRRVKLSSAIFIKWRGDRETRWRRMGNEPEIMQI